MDDQQREPTRETFWRRRWDVDRPLIVAVCGVAIVATLVMVGLVAEVVISRRPLTFQAERWRNEPATLDHSSVRLRMVDDLLNRALLIGLTRDEVVGMLGEPPGTDYFRAWDLVYVLGPERGFISVDNEWLLIRLDDSGRVSEAVTATD